MKSTVLSVMTFATTIIPTFVMTSAVGLVFAGCNYNDVKNQPGSTGRPAQSGSPNSGTPEAAVDFATVRAAVFEPACIKCHGPTLAKAGLRLDQYASAFARLDLIRSEVEGGTMPPPPPRGSILQPEQKAMLIAWIDSGGPERTVVTPVTPPPVTPVTPPPVTPVTPPPVTPPAPITATPSFADVSSAVFVPHCIKCHSNTVEKGKVNLEQYTTAAKHAAAIGTELDTDDMPRKAPALPADLKAIVYAWIAGGAPEFATPAAPPPVPQPVSPPAEDDNGHRKL